VEHENLALHLIKVRFPAARAENLRNCSESSVFETLTRQIALPLLASEAAFDQPIRAGSPRLLSGA